MRNLFKISLILLVGACSDVTNAQSPSNPPSPIEGAGPAELVIVVDPGFVGIVIDSPMANYGVSTEISVPPEYHGVPETKDYKYLRAQISKALNPTLKDVEASAASKFAFNAEAICKFDVGNERIAERDAAWRVVFDIEFMCARPSKLKTVSINLFDMEGFSEATGLIINGDLEFPFEIDGINRKLDLW